MSTLKHMQTTGYSGALTAAYAPMRPPGPIDLHLDANEAVVPSVDIAALLTELNPAVVARYPGATALEAAIARRLGVHSARVLVTAGGDEAIDRACRAYLYSGAEIILPVPTFEMIERYAHLAQAKVIPVPWRQGPFPLKAVLEHVNPSTAMIAMVSPNNPTGAVAQAEDLQRLSALAPQAQLLVDLAYEEFAENPLTLTAIALPNTIIIRTFSKAFGLAGLRVGYAVASESAARAMRITGSPYSVSTLSIAGAQKALELPDAWLIESVDRVRDERARLQQCLMELGATPSESQGNFVLARFSDALWVWQALAGLGIAVRRFASAELRQHVRISCPGHAHSFARLQSGLRSALKPEVVVFASECLRSSDAESLKKLSTRVPLALISGNSLAECQSDLRAAGMQSLFAFAVSLQEVPSYTAAIQSVLRQRNTQFGWMLCDSIESISDARTAGLVPLALHSRNPKATNNDSALERAGAARVLSSLSQLEGMFP